MATDELTTELRQDMAALKADFSSLLEVIRAMGVEQGRMAADRLRDTGERATGQVRAAQDDLEHYIEARPLTSVLVALGIGFAVGSLMGKRR